MTPASKTELSLRAVRDELEQRVQQRTAELEQAVQDLRKEVKERKRAEAALRESEARLGLALAGSDLGCWEWHLPTGTGSLDERSADLFGYSTRELVENLGLGRQLVHPDDVESVLLAWDSYMKDTSRIFETEVRVRHRSGEWRWIQTRGKAMEWAEQGLPVRVSGTSRDITDRKHSEERLRRQQAELAHLLRVATMGEMTAQLAHEMNQPLAAIANYAAGIAERLRSDTRSEGIQTAAEWIAAEALRAGEIIRRLRAFVRKGSTVAEVCDVNQLTLDAIHLIQHDAKEHGIVTRLSPCERLPVLSVDRVQIQQVLVNLLRNAIDAMNGEPREGNEISVATAHQDGFVSVSVTDTGVGLPDSGAIEIFERFVTTKPNGLGMGLSISRSIVEAHGGTLEAEQNAERGATFTLTLPVPEVAMRPSSESEGQPR